MKKWIALIASVVMQTCLGSVYAWSTFVPALQSEHGVSSGRAGLIFGVCIASFTISMVYAGILQQRHGPRIVGMIGGCLFLLGYVLGSSFGDSYGMMLLGFGLLAGAGIGFAYVCPLTTGVKWFPERKGFITGLAVAGFGLGGVFFAKAGHQMLDGGMPVLDLLRFVGGIVGVCAFVCSGFLFVPERPQGSVSSIPRRNFRFFEILKQRRFHSLFLQMFCGTFGGLLIIGNLKPIGISGGLTPKTATVAVMLFAVGNAAGRVSWGICYDRFGRNTVTACMGLLAISGVMMGIAANPWMLYSAAIIIGFSFGGCFVLFAARTADTFGTDRLSEIYPLVFLGYGIAGLAGPPFGGWLLHQADSPLLPCMAVCFLAFAGGVISLERKNGSRILNLFRSGACSSTRL